MIAGDAQPVPAVVLGESSRRLRRALGPTAWAVLEELISRADQAGMAAMNVSQLADAVGLSVDAVGAAVRRLQQAGVVERVAQRHGSHGRFGPGGYRLRLPGGVVVDAPGVGSPEPVTAAAVKRIGQRRVEQPGLFDLHPNDHISNPTTNQLQRTNPSTSNPNQPTTP